jgi:hypothetical protein
MSLPVNSELSTVSVRLLNPGPEALTHDQNTICSKKRGLGLTYDRYPIVLRLLQHFVAVTITTVYRRNYAVKNKYFTVLTRQNNAVTSNRLAKINIV